MNPDDLSTETLIETENYSAWLSVEPDGENVIHLELGQVTVHFFREEWDELLQVIDGAKQALKPKKK